MNEINLFGPIGKTPDGTGITSQQIKTQLAAMDQTQPLIVRIDSEGGSVFDGLSLYEAFASYSGPKEAVIESTAFSIASYIATAFNSVTIAENGYIMIHEPSTDAGGTAADLQSTAEVLGKLDKSMVDAYVRKTGRSEIEVKKMMAAETFLNAQEALQMGFVDAIAKRNVPTRINPMACQKSMPQRVFAALFGAGSGGETDDLNRGKSMSNQTPIAATVKEIRAAYPKAKPEFILTCVERELPMASVATEAAAQMMEENAMLMAQVQSLTAELAALKGKAMEEPMPMEEEEEEEEAPAPAAKNKIAARNGVRPVAAARTSGSKLSAQAEWQTAVDEQLKITSGNRMKAVANVNKRHPGLRERMVAEVNAR